MHLIDLISNRKIPVTTPRCRVGRDDANDIVVTGDNSISRFHFVITNVDDQYLVEDSKSQFGTFLNGNKINGQAPLKNGDAIKIGVSLFWVEIDS